MDYSSGNIAITEVTKSIHWYKASWLDDRMLVRRKRNQFLRAHLPGRFGAMVSRLYMTTSYYLEWVSEGKFNLIYKKIKNRIINNGKSITKNALFNILYKVLNVLFPLVTTIYISRILCPAGVGKVAFAQNVCSYFTVVAALGLPTYGIREIARHRNDRNKVDELFSDFFWINIISTSLCVTVYLMSVVFSSNQTLFYFLPVDFRFF